MTVQHHDIKDFARAYMTPNVPGVALPWLFFGHNDQVPPLPSHCARARTSLPRMNAACRYTAPCLLLSHPLFPLGQVYTKDRPVSTRFTRRTAELDHIAKTMFLCSMAVDHVHPHFPSYRRPDGEGKVCGCARKAMLRRMEPELVVGWRLDAPCTERVGCCVCRYLLQAARQWVAVGTDPATKKFKMSTRRHSLIRQVNILPVEESAAMVFHFYNKVRPWRRQPAPPHSALAATAPGLRPTSTRTHQPMAVSIA